MNLEVDDEIKQSEVGNFQKMDDHISNYTDLLFAHSHSVHLGGSQQTGECLSQTQKKGIKQVSDSCIQNERAADPATAMPDKNINYLAPTLFDTISDESSELEILQPDEEDQNLYKTTSPATCNQDEDEDTIKFEGLEIASSSDSGNDLEFTTSVTKQFQ